MTAIVLTATRARSVPHDGPARFARYAYPPNALGYCGPDASERLHQYAASGSSDGGLRELAAGFEGAFPYLQLIATANAIADPLDARVVEAYWLGTSAAGAVRPADFHRSVADRFRPRLAIPEWRRLEATVPAGARPVHAFHVLDVLPRVGMLRGGRVDDLLGVADACRIRWATVEAVDGGRLVVRAPRISLVEGRLAITDGRPEVVAAWPALPGELPLAVGDVVSLHWGWACERLDPRMLSALQRSTRRQLEVANRAI